MQNTKLIQQSAYINWLFDEMIPDGFQDDHDLLLTPLSSSRVLSIR